MGWLPRKLPLAVCVGALALAGCAAPYLPMRAKVDGIVIHGEMNDALAGEMARAGAQTVRDICATLDLAVPAQPVDLHAFEWSWQRLRFLLARCPSHTFARAACFTSGDDIVIAMTRESDHDELLRIVRHETTHYVLDVYYVTLPPWVQEGLARYFELGPPYGVANPDALDRVLSEARAGKGGALDDLVRTPFGDGLSRRDYARSWALVGCILKDLPDGPARLRRYMERVIPQRDAAAQFEEAFGASPSGMASAWRAYILRLAPPER